MVFSLKKQNNKVMISADVVDDYLILSLPNALEPVVWRMAMDKIGTAAFEVKQEAKSEKANLILKPKKGTAEIIAPFATKEEAIEALVAASNAMHNGSTHNAPTRKNNIIKNNSKISNSSETQKWIIVLLGAIIVIGLYSYLTTLIPDTIESNSLSNQASMATNAPQETTGVPVSADDFLGQLQ
jgi:hypothetical protein